MTNSYQIKISIEESNPEIWRRLIVPKTFKLSQLHELIQLAFDWQNCHLHEFKINGKTISSESKTLDKILKVSDQFEYTYDFGDNWNHIIEVEAEVMTDLGPKCIDGKMAGPVEDIGGIYAYESYVGYFKDKKCDEHEEAVAFLGPKFKANKFDLNSLNSSLANF